MAPVPQPAAVPADPAPRRDIVFRGVERLFGIPGQAIAGLGRIDLTIQDGEIFVLVGPSGCGKTTLLNLVGGFDRPTRGEIAVGGARVTGPGPDRVVVFQEPLIFPWLTVVGNITFGPSLRHAGRKAIEADCREFTRAIGLEGFESHYPYQLSGGMRQRVALARALINRPRALLMDEPFSALDAQTRIQMQELFLGVWQQFQTTTLFITHDVEEAIFLGDRVAVMAARPGRISKVFEVDIARPRVADTTTEPEFIRLKREVLSVLRNEGAGFV